MSIEIPETAIEVENRAKTDVQRELVEANPFLKNSWLGALITSFANRIFDFYLQLLAAITQSLPDTATLTFLERWAAIWGKQRLAATQATGNVVATGTVGGTIPLGSVVTGSADSYTTTSAASISAQVLAVASILRTGQTATVTTISNHGLANSVLVTHAGADEAAYNVAADITVTGLGTYEYQVIGSPLTPAAGTITAAGTFANLPVAADNFGVGSNIVSGTQLTLQSPLVDVDDTLTVDFEGVGGGADQENDAGLRTRMLDRIQNPVAQFNVAAITDKAKEVAGVTRVFVQEITPEVGQVTIFFMRDDDENPIPTGTQVTVVANKINEIRPANTDILDVIVSAPTAVTVPFTFSALSPDTATIRTAINANLQQFFEENPQVGVNIDQDAYRSAIFNTVDPATGDLVLSFSLSTPTADIVIAAGEIGVLGAIIYAV